MIQSVFHEMEFILLIVFSIVIPVGIYGFLYKTFAISRWTVIAFAMLLLVVAGIDVVLLQSLSQLAKASASAFDDKVFSGEVSLALYLFPAAFAGLGVSLLSHVLVSHLKAAEREFDRRPRTSGRGTPRPLPQLRRGIAIPENLSESSVLIASAAGVAAIFAIDLVTGADIQLHVLYVFPLALLARYCARLGITIAALSVTTILQVITFSTQAKAIPPFLTDVCVALAASLVVIVLARTSRNSYLAAADQAATDPLTRIANRRAFTQELQSEISRQRRYGGVFSLAMLDLDGLKALNDTRGHSTGDAALELAAEILRDGTRESDAIGRLGGDEFAILLPNTKHQACALMLTKLCATLAARMAAAGYDITASIGAKLFAVPPESTAQALRQADEIMYEAKSAGRNRALIS